MPFIMCECILPLFIRRGLVVGGILFLTLILKKSLQTLISMADPSKSNTRFSVKLYIILFMFNILNHSFYHELNV